MSANVAELLNIAKAYGVEATQGVTGDGKLSLDLHVKGPLANASALSYVGSATIAGLTVNSPELRKPLSIASAHASFSQNSVSLDHLTASLGSSSVQGSLSAKNFAAPQVAFDLTADKVDVDELQNIVNATPSKPTKGGKTQSPSLFLATTGTGMLGRGHDQIKRHPAEEGQPQNAGSIRASVQLSPLSAEIFGGKASGSLTADMRGTTPQCSENVKFAGVDANSLLSAVSSMKDTVSGSLAADTNLRFALAAGNELTRTLNGVITFDLANGEIKNINLINEVNKIGRLLSKGGQGSVTERPIQKFAGALTIVNGVANTQNLVGELTEGSLAAKGSLNLVNDDVNMHVTATLGKCIRQPVGGSLLNTVLEPAGAIHGAGDGKRQHGAPERDARRG